MIYSRKKQLGGVQDIEFPGVKNRMWKFQVSIKKEVEFPGVFKKTSCGISMGLGFWP